MRIQFRIRSMLICMICIALVVSVAVRIYGGRSPQWPLYTSTSVKTALEKDHAVLISLSANWCISGNMHEQMAINNAETFRTIRANGVTTLRADATNLDPAVMQLMKDNGLNSLPAFLIYSPAIPNEPIILKGLVSQQELLEAIRRNSERSIRN